MATTVVSGRVDERVKLEVDKILAHAGKTPGDVIRDVWISIYETGRLPTAADEDRRFQDQRYRFSKFMEFVKNQPPAPDWLINLTDDEMHDMLVDDLLKEAL